MNLQPNKSTLAASILPSCYKTIQRIIIKNRCSFLFFAFSQEGLQVLPSVFRTTSKLKYVYKHNTFTKVVKRLSRISNSKTSFKRPCVIIKESSSNALVSNSKFMLSSSSYLFLNSLDLISTR